MAGNLKFLLTYIMGKLKIGIYCYLIADTCILTKVFQKCLLNVPLPNIHFLFKPLNLIGCHGNQKAKFMKYIKKATSQKLYGG